MYFKHNKFASISPICFRLRQQTVEQPRGWGVESDEANLPRAEVNSENTGTADEDASQEDTSVNVRESKKTVPSFWQTYTFT